MTFFRIRLFTEGLDVLDDFGIPDEALGHDLTLLFEGSDLAALTADLRCRREYWDTRIQEIREDTGLWIEHAVEITAVNHHDEEPPIDWDSRGAHDFWRALAALECTKVFVYNFLGFPLPLLEMFLAREQLERVILHDKVPDGMSSVPASSLDIPSFTGSSPLAFCGRLELHVCNVFRASDWTAYVSYLQKVLYSPSSRASFQESRTFLKEVFLYLEVPDDVADMQQEYQLFIKAVCSIPTIHLGINAQEFQYSFLSSLVFTGNFDSLLLVFSDLHLSLCADFVEQHVNISTNGSNPDWLVVTAWLQQIRLLNHMTWLECCLYIRPREEMNPQQYLTAFESMCALQAERVVISSYGCRCSLVLVPILLKSFQSSGKALPKLHVSAPDLDWMNDEKVVEALKGKTRILEMTIEAIECQPEILKKMETVLQANHTITSLRLDEQATLTPTMKMYLGLNKHGKRNLLASKGAHDLSPEEWIRLLLSTIEDSTSTDDVKLSCLFYFVRNYSAYYGSLFMMDGR